MRVASVVPNGAGARVSSPLMVASVDWSGPRAAVSAMVIVSSAVRVSDKLKVIARLLGFIVADLEISISCVKLPVEVVRVVMSMQVGGLGGSLGLRRRSGSAIMTRSQIEEGSVWMLDSEDLERS